MLNIVDGGLCTDFVMLSVEKYKEGSTSTYCSVITAFHIVGFQRIE